MLLIMTVIPCSFLWAKPDLNDLHLPSGFKISYFHKNTPGARSLTLGKSTIFVSTRSEGRIYALRDTNNDGIADKRYVIARNLNMPNGIAFHNKDLYVAEVHRIIRYKNIEQQLDTPPAPEIIYNKLNNKRHHGWRYIGISPTGHLVISIGAPCNVCIPDKTALIKQINLKTLKTTVLARGVRNSVGFDWHPMTKQLWFTDNGRDLMGDTIPADELNRIIKPGQHFGFPVCHGGTVLDPRYGKKGNCKHYVKPAWGFKAHVAPLGMRFYTGQMFPKKYHQQLFVAQHGSWNRSNKVGYQVMLVTLGVQFKHVKSAVPFVTGWLNNERSSGRPVDLLVMHDGSLLISDDKAGVIYRIIYSKNRQ